MVVGVVVGGGNGNVVVVVAAAAAGTAETAAAANKQRRYIEKDHCSVQEEKSSIGRSGRLSLPTLPAVASWYFTGRLGAAKDPDFRKGKLPKEILDGRLPTRGLLMRYTLQKVYEFIIDPTTGLSGGGNPTAGIATLQPVC